MKIQTLTASTEAHAQQAEGILRSCVHCGLCNATCPTYQLLHNECDGPRGRIYLIKQVLEGEAVSLQTLQHLDRCLTCRACETTCPSGVQYAKLLDIGRVQLEQQVCRPLIQRLQRAALCYVLPYPQRFKPVLKMAQLFKPVLPKKLADYLPNPTVGMNCQQLDSDILCRNDRKVRKMLILEGCVQSCLAPSINQAAAVVLERFGISLINAGGCCGAISQHNFAPHEALAFARRNIDAWLPYLEQGVEGIISTASGCGVMVKDYGELLQHDSHYADKARRISATTRDLVEVVLAENLSRLKFKATAKIAVQSPCTLQHGQKLSGSVERLLQNLGFTLCPVADSHLCCGSAGTYSLLQPKLAHQLGQNKIANLEQQQPDMIATANIGCLTHLQQRTNTAVRHWIEIVASLLAE
jgi:glycolate oxidase iron-sulfur subunit